MENRVYELPQGDWKGGAGSALSTGELANLHRFRFRAVVDWISFEVTTQRNTNFPALQRALQRILDLDTRPYVEPLDVGPGGATNRFRVRVQDPGSYDVLKHSVIQLHDQFPLAETPLLQAIEVSVDAYSRAQSASELEAMVLRMKLGIDVHGQTELECGLSNRALDNVDHVRADTTLVIREPGVEWKIYFKRTDNNQRPIVDSSLHRARTEVCLSGNRLPASLRHVDGLAVFRFESLVPMFPFRRISPNAELTAAPQDAAGAAALRRSQLASTHGHRWLPVPPRRTRRKHHPLTRADSELRERFRNALRDLTRRFCKKPGEKMGGA